MSGLVAMIVLLYLLVIAICVTLWAAASLLRETPEQVEAREARTGSAGFSNGSSGHHRVGGDRSGDREERSRRRDVTHDEYRGARAKERRAEARERAEDTRAAAQARAETRAETRAQTRAEHRSEAPNRQAERKPRSAHRPDLPRETSSGPVRTDGIRVTESRRERDRRAQDASADNERDRTAKEDPFDRFLRANEDFER